jgi:hypothetical protein
VTAAQPDPGLDIRRAEDFPLDHRPWEIRAESSDRSDHEVYQFGATVTIDEATGALVVTDGTAPNAPTPFTVYDRPYIDIRVDAATGLKFTESQLQAIAAAGAASAIELKQGSSAPYNLDDPDLIVEPKHVRRWPRPRGDDAKPDARSGRKSRQQCHPSARFAGANVCA